MEQHSSNEQPNSDSSQRPLPPEIDWPPPPGRQRIIDEIQAQQDQSPKSIVPHNRTAKELSDDEITGLIQTVKHLDHPRPTNE